MNGRLPGPANLKIDLSPQEKATQEQVAVGEAVRPNGQAKPKPSEEVVRPQEPHMQLSEFLKTQPARVESINHTERKTLQGSLRGFGKTLRSLLYILALILLLGWILFWLNFFGVLKLSQTIPALQFLPMISQGVDQNIIKDIKSQPNVSMVLGGQQLPCPSIKEFCTNGKDVMQNGAYAGLGANVSLGSAIMAVFDGEMTVVSSIYPPQFNREKIAAIYLDDKEKNLRAAYFFKGDVPVAKKVKAGTIIGKTGGGLASYNNVSLLFQLIKGDPVKGERIKLSSQDFTN